VCDGENFIDEDCRVNHVQCIKCAMCWYCARVENLQTDFIFDHK
jgi:hypothetical protein